ncbi:MAG: hypothetical protein JST82_05520 [Bacteroidetes bacterium]|nr:hypothetical protein [Bacteroidota bacterium]
MKPFIYLFIALCLLGCKKENVSSVPKATEYKTTDFALIPTKDAKWYVHMIGDQNCFPYQDPTDMNIEGAKDLLWDYHFLIEALGKDTVIDNYTYHVYQYTLNAFGPYYSGDTIRDHKYRYYLREDTLTKKVYSGHARNAVENNEFFLVADFSDNTNKGQVSPFPAWREVNVLNGGGYILGGQYFKSWKMQNIYDHSLEYFYKAIGIGTTKAILPDYYFGNNLVYQTLSLDFVYKGDSIHFEFPMQ